MIASMDATALDQRLRQTARTVSAMHALGQATRRTRIPQAHHSTMIESDYATHLVQIVGHARSAARPLLDELPRLMRSAHSEHMRVDDGEGRKAIALLHLSRERMAAVTRQDVTARFVTAIGTREVVHQHNQFSRQVRAALGVYLWTPKVPKARHVIVGRTDSVRLDSRALRYDSVGSRLDEFVTANVAQIKSLGNQPLDQIEKLVLDAFSIGKRHETLAKEIQQRFVVAESSARLIARSQLGRLYARVAIDRQKEIGLKQWQWMTVLDEAVRATHKVLHGQIYDHDPDGRQPPFPVGYEPNCRCSPQPVFGSALDMLDALERGEMDPDDIPTSPTSVSISVPAPRSATKTTAPFPAQPKVETVPPPAAPSPLSVVTKPSSPTPPAVVPQTSVAPASSPATIDPGPRIGIPNGMRVGVSNVPGEIEANRITGVRISQQLERIKQIAQAAEPPVSLPGPAFRTPGEVPRDTVIPSDKPAPVGYESVEHDGKLYYRHRSSGRSYTPEQYDERSDPKRNGYGIELTGPNPNDRIPGFSAWEIKGSKNGPAEIRYRMPNGSGQAYSREQVASGEAVESEAWIASAKESEAKRPGFLKRIGQWIIGTGKGR